MAIKTVEVEKGDFVGHRKWLKDRGFFSGYYFSQNGFDVAKLKIMALQGKMDAIRCTVGRTIKWYYSEKQAEIAHLRGQV